jgi:hypothetical protein
MATSLIFISFCCCLGFFFLVWFSETVSHYVAQAGLKLVTLLPQSLECRDYSYAPPHPACQFLYNHEDYYTFFPACLVRNATGAYGMYYKGIEITSAYHSILHACMHSFLQKIPQIQRTVVQALTTMT